MKDHYIIEQCIIWSRCGEKKTIRQLAILDLVTKYSRNDAGSDQNQNEDGHKQRDKSRDFLNARMRIQQLDINEIDRSYSRDPSLVVVAFDHDALMTRILRSGKRRRDTLNASASNAGRSTPLTSQRRDSTGRR